MLEMPCDVTDAKGWWCTLPYGHTTDHLFSVGGAAERPAGPDAAAIGYYVWTDKGGLAFRSKLHPTRETAEQALDSVVWHNRDEYRVRPVYLGKPADLRETRTHLNALAVSAPSGDEKGGDAPSVNAGSAVGEPREPPAPSDAAISAGVAAFTHGGSLRGHQLFRAVGKAMYAVDFPVRAGEPPTEPTECPKCARLAAAFATMDTEDAEVRARRDTLAELTAESQRLGLYESGGGPPHERATND